MQLQLVDIKSYRIAPQYLSLYRLLYCLCIMVFVGLPSYTWLSSDLNIFFNPPPYSIANIFNGFPPALFFKILTLLNIIFFGLMFLGIYCRWTSIAFAITAIIGHNYCYSFGKIDHLLIWLIAPIFLSLAGWGNHFTIGSSKDKQNTTVNQQDNSIYIIMLAMTIAFSMFTSGVQKVLGGWQSWEAEAVRYHLIKKYYSLGSLDLLADYFMSIKNHLVWKFFDYSGLMLELGFIFSIMRRKWFQVFLVGGTIFHILVLLMFNIPFYSNIIVYLVFINWDDIFKRFNYNFITKSINGIKIANYILVAGSCIILYWLYWFFTAGSIFIIPGVIDITDQKMLQSTSKTAMRLLFLSSFIVLVFCVTIAAFNRFKTKRINY
ncbi:MAG: hypothetical protein EOP47_17995 [Sphingobacteriaceae bacterium]|nr:MAG: hypothetical protein EOP47_17995 [Sphingobacteriaceae bacterium]